MAEAQDSDIEEIIKRLPSILPEYDGGNFEGKKVVFFPFARPDTKVEFSPVTLEQGLPGKVFSVSHPECVQEYPMHEEKLRQIVRERFNELSDQKSKALKIFFRQFLFRKKEHLEDMSAEEVTDKVMAPDPIVKVNGRNQYMVQDDDKFLEIFRRLGAVQESEERKPDCLKTQLMIDDNRRNFFMVLDAETLMLLKISQGIFIPSKKPCIPFPSAVTEDELTGAGIILPLARSDKIGIDVLCSECSEDESLHSILKTPGLGILKKEHIQENIYYRRKINRMLDYLMLFKDRVKYIFRLEGVKIAIDCASGVNHNFERGKSQTFVHQRFGREPRLKIYRNAEHSVDHFVSVVTRVIFALKNATQSKELRFKMYDVVEKSNRRLDLAKDWAPAWCRNRQTQKNSILEDLKRVRDNDDLPAMLGSQPDAHLIALRPKARSLLQKMNDVTPAEMERYGLDLTALRQKLLDAASRRGLTLNP